MSRTIFACTVLLTGAILFFAVVIEDVDWFIPLVAFSTITLMLWRFISRASPE